MKKFILTLITALPIFTLLHARGDIITSDNQIVAFNNSDEKRIYPFKNTLEPLLGYCNSKTEGAMGLEQSMNIRLKEGLNVHLTIDLALQRSIESVLDESKQEYDADDVIMAVMDSSTGQVLAMASSNRYNPNYLTRNDIPSLFQKFAAYPYEPGSVMKPIALAIAMDKGLVEPETVFNTYDGKFEFEEGIFISDSQKFNTLSATDIIVRSSNIGITQVSQLLSGYEFYQGLEKFGLVEPSGIDLTRDREGRFRLANDLENRRYRASTSYGYGMLATFTQLLKAYSVFNNNGITVTPQLIISLQENKETQFNIPVEAETRVRVLNSKTAKNMHKILIENVKRGTAIHTQIEGLEIGGKTATAHIAKNGRYVREFHSSFYGFVNDNTGSKYTIGVLVIRAKVLKSYFSSRSAVPVFREIVEKMISFGYLKSNINKKEK